MKEVFILNKHICPICDRKCSLKYKNLFGQKVFECEAHGLFEVEDE